MSSDYNMKANVSNVVIIDKGGRIRFFTAGDVSADEISRVKELLQALAGEHIENLFIGELARPR